MTKISDQIETVDIDSIRSDPDQPRQTFLEDRLQEMATTLKSTGMINPILVDKEGMIIAGEMRWRSAKLAGLSQVSIRRYNPASMWERRKMQIIENDQHTDISGYEKAVAYRAAHKEFMKTYTPNRPNDQGIMAMAKDLGIADSTLSCALRVAGDDFPAELIDLMKRSSFSASQLTLLNNLPLEISKRLIPRFFVELDSGRSIRGGGTVFSCFLRVLKWPELLDAALDIFFAESVNDHQTQGLLEALLKEEKTEAEKEQEGLNNLWRAFRTINKAMDFWRDDMANVPPFCRDMLLAKAGRTYRRLDTFFESVPEFQVEGE